MDEYVGTLMNSHVNEHEDLNRVSYIIEYINTHLNTFYDVIHEYTY